MSLLKYLMYQKKISLFCFEKKTSEIYNLEVKQMIDLQNHLDFKHVSHSKRLTKVLKKIDAHLKRY